MTSEKGINFMEEEGGALLRKERNFSIDIHFILFSGVSGQGGKAINNIFYTLIFNLLLQQVLNILILSK